MNKAIILSFMCFLSACSTVGGNTKTSGSIKNTPVVVHCTGDTLDNAKKRCFQNAIEDVVGLLLVSEKEVKNQNVVKNEIINYSAGYVDDYQILNQKVEGKKISLEMLVRVADSKIQDRILGKFTDKVSVNGDQYATQFESYIDHMESGDQLLKSLLHNYPERAFNIKVTGHEYNLNSNRDSILTVYYELEWNQKYLKALNEALAKTSDPKSKEIQQHSIFIQSNPRDSFIGSTDGYYFNDDRRANFIKNTFVGKITVDASLVDERNNKVYTSCSNPMVFVGLFNDNSDKRSPYVIRGNEKDRDAIQFKIPNNNTNIESFKKSTKINLTYRRGGCNNLQS